MEFVVGTIEAENYAVYLESVGAFQSKLSAD
jgi:hypothetical protein